jgi:hypothetical protein
LSQPQTQQSPTGESSNRRKNKQAPTDCKLMTEKQDIVDQILHCEIKLKDEVEMKLTDDKKMAHINAW